MKKFNKRLILMTFFMCSLLFLNISNFAYAESSDSNKSESGTVDINNQSGSVAEPPSGPNVNVNGSDKQEENVDVETPKSVTGKKVQGTGTVTDFTTSGSKAFYTITDKDQNVFYLIIDLDKTENNVYFLSDVQKATLDGSEQKENVSPAPMTNTDSSSTKTEDKANDSGSGDNTFLIVVALIFVGALVIIYFKKFKNKKENNTSNEEEEMMEDDFYEENENFDDDENKKAD